MLYGGVDEYDTRGSTVEMSKLPSPSGFWLLIVITPVGMVTFPVPSGFLPLTLCTAVSPPASMIPHTLGSERVSVMSPSEMDSTPWPTRTVHRPNSNTELSRVIPGAVGSAAGVPVFTAISHEFDA